MRLPIDYKKLLIDRVIIITGAGRSGTTILGKLIGSMEPAYYLFEPSIMKFSQDVEALRATIFEDYWLLQVQGRNINVNSHDDSFIWNYLPKHVFHPEREDALERMSRSKLVIKLTEYQPMINDMRHVFPGCKFVHIIRNGNDVVDSMCRRGWYTDEYMKTGFLDWVDNGAPWFIDDDSKLRWYGWNQETRAACVWRCSTEVGIRERGRLLTPHGDIFMATYEDLIDYTSLLSEWLNLRPTELTNQHALSIKEPKEHPNIIDKIQQPERDKFLSLMGELGYGDMDNRP